MSTLPNNQFTGKPCIRCGYLHRYKSNRKCVNCSLIFHRNYNKDKARREKENVRGRNFFEKNPNKRKEKNNKYLKSNPESSIIRSQRRRSRKKLVVCEQYSIQQLKDRFSVFDNCCVYCLKGEFITIDHFIPISKGGADALYNLVPACKSCNSSKNNSDPIQWMKKKGHSNVCINNLLTLIEENK